MARYNRTFYDLNRERHYCFAMPGEEIPTGVLADLKLSVPSDTAIPFISGILLKGDAVKLTIAVGGEIVASYSSESRSMLRAGRTYTLKSWKEGYEGVLVFGELKTDVDYKGNVSTSTISEECLTRFQPSAIPYISLPCTNTRLTGEVFLGGDQVNVRSFTENLPPEMFSAKESMMLDLIDTKTVDATNPMILYANGINAFNAVEEMRSPIYTIHGVRPDQAGTVFVNFEDHFRLAAVIQNLLDTEAEESKISAVTVGTDITQDMVCYKSEPDHDEKEIPDCDITFVSIDYL
jgi:hypothetical protein